MELQRGGDAQARWEMARSAPDPRLRAHVTGYCGYRERAVAPLSRLEEPPGAVVVIFSFGPEIDVVWPSGRRTRHGSFAVGMQESWSLTEYEGDQHGIEVRMSPAAARALLGVPVRELVNSCVDLEDIAGRRGSDLVERLAVAPGWAERFALLDAEIMQRLANSPPPPPAVELTWGRLTASGGSERVARLAKELGYSRRHLSDRFRDEIGLPPKTVARILRFNRVARRLRAGGEPDLATLALSCGYYDQSHLNRDFREFAGCTPGEFLARRMPAGAGVAAA